MVMDYCLTVTMVMEDCQYKVEYWKKMDTMDVGFEFVRLRVLQQSRYSGHFEEIRRFLVLAMAVM